MGATSSHSSYQEYLDSCDDEIFEMSVEGIVSPEHSLQKEGRLNKTFAIKKAVRRASTTFGIRKEPKLTSGQQRKDVAPNDTPAKQRKTNVAIEKSLAKENRKQGAQTDIVLFGRVGSGKSTLLKQLLLATLIDDNSCRSSSHFRQALEEESAASTIERNKSDMFKTIFRGLSKVLHLAENKHPEKWDNSLADAKERFVLLQDFKHKAVPEEIAALAQGIWSDERVAEVFEKEGHRLNESTALAHYMANRKVFEADYVMTIKDWLFASGKSKVYETTDITHKSCRFRILEANADSAPNKILAKYFSRAFLAHVVDVSEFDEYEYLNGRKVNKLAVSMRHFKRVMEDQRLDIYHCFLVFSKSDRMRKKLSRVPFSIPSGEKGARWSDYYGKILEHPVSEAEAVNRSNREFEQYYADVIRYLQQEFMRQIPGQRDVGCPRRVDLYSGSCFDPAMVDALFKSCEGAILAANLGAQGNADFPRRAVF